MKIMGIDYGDARTGVAISDLLCTLVGSATVVPSRNTEKAIADIVRLAQENQVGEIVVGLPKNMDGTEGVRAELCREFADKLAQATGLPREHVGRAPNHGGSPQYPVPAQLSREKAEGHGGRRGGVPDSGRISGLQEAERLSYDFGR